MNKLLYTFFFSIFFLDYFHFSLEIIPRAATWVPEFLTMIAGLIVALRFALKRKFDMHPKYIYLIILYSVVVFTGTVLNATPAKVLIIGIRHYYKHLPFFLLPAVYDFSERQLKKQLLFLLPLLMLQCPIALYQKYIEFKDSMTGDVITGSLGWSDGLSITLVCAMSVVFAFYLKKRIHLLLFLIAEFCIFVPTTINETKVTIVLLPFVFLIPALLCDGCVNSGKIKNLLIVSLVGILFFSVFVCVYDRQENAQGGGILKFFTNKKVRDSYLFENDDRDEDSSNVRRGDALVLAYSHLSKDVCTMAVGLGIGNVMDSILNEEEGGNFDTLGAEELTVTHFFWETGIIGVITYLGFYICFFADAYALKKRDDIFGVLALGWIGLMTILTICLIYTNIGHQNAINFMFWYFSGLLASHLFRTSRSEEKYSSSAVQPVSNPAKIY